MTSYFFKYPFAVSGDVSAIPPTTQPDGSVSYQQGYPINYEQNLLTVPTAQPINRQQFNELMFSITDNLNQYQTHANPYWISSADNLGSPYAYDIYAIVRYNEGSPGDEGAGTLTYMNMVQGNTATPGADASWLPLGFAMFDQVLYVDSVAMTDTDPINLLELELPVGKWLVQGNVAVEFATTASTNYAYSWLNTSSETQPDESELSAAYSVGIPTGLVSLTTPVRLVTVTSGTTIIYLSASAFFSTGTAKSCGTISAIPL